MRPEPGSLVHVLTMVRHPPPTLSLEAMVAIARAAVPAIEGRDAQVVARGWDNVAVSLDDSWIARFQQPNAAGSLAVEVALLEAVAGKTALATPVPVAADALGPHPYVIYRAIPGIRMPTAITGEVRRETAATLAQFCAELHIAVPWKAASALGVSEAHPLANESIDAAAAVLRDPVLQRLLHNAAAAERTAHAQTEWRVLLHNDLHHNNIAWDSDRSAVNGVFDFGDARVGDVHREFAAMYQADADLGRELAAAYFSRTGRTIFMDRVAVHTVIRCAYDLLTTEFGQANRERLELLAADHPALLARPPRVIQEST